MDISPNLPVDGPVQRAFCTLWAFWHRSEALAIWRITQHPVTPPDGTLSVTARCCFWLRFRSGRQAGRLAAPRRTGPEPEDLAAAVKSLPRIFICILFRIRVLNGVLVLALLHVRRSARSCISGLASDPSFPGGLV